MVGVLSVTFFMVHFHYDTMKDLLEKCALWSQTFWIFIQALPLLAMLSLCKFLNSYFLRFFIKGGQ